MRTDATIQRVYAAVQAVEAALLTENDAQFRDQLEMVRKALWEMHTSLTGPLPLTTDMGWLAQMVADQWDPMWPITELVIRASQDYSRWDSHSLP